MKIALKKIVGQFLNSKDGTTHEFARLYNMAVRGMRSTFQLDVTGRMKTVLLTVAPNKTVALPSDYVTYGKVGVVDAHGKIYTFKHNEDLISLRGDVSVGTTYSGVDRKTIYANYVLYGHTYNLFGVALGTATIGEFHIDETDCVIRLDNENPYSEILLEYLPDGWDESHRDHCIDIRAEEAFIAWLRWQNAVDRHKQFSDRQVAGFRKEFYRLKRDARIKMNPVIISEMENVRRESIKLVAKA